MANETNSEKTCFVVMGFGKKTDFETGRVLDLDKSYRNMIKPAVEAAGFQCIRADEIVHSGLIDVPMYEQLLNADVVVADLSTSNKNAYYELGIRHALRPFTTVIICEDGIKTIPFDVNHIAVRQYHHLGEDIGFEEVMRFRAELTDAIKTITKTPCAEDSPVYTFIKNLTPPAISAAVQAQVQALVDAAPGKQTAETGNAKPGNASFENSETHVMLMKQVDDAQQKSDWATAKTFLLTIQKMMERQDPYIIQRLALATYKDKSQDEVKALIEAQQLLAVLKPDISNDTETLGQWGSIHKRLWELEKNAGRPKPELLNTAIRAYERGFYIKNDYYNGINYAFLLNVRAAEPGLDTAEAIADFVDAHRIRKEVLSICEKWISDNPVPPEPQIPADELKKYFNNWYWVMATKAEARIGMGEDDEGQKILDEAYKKAPASWMEGTTKDQLAKLKSLLNISPLKYIKKDN